MVFLGLVGGGKAQPGIVDQSCSPCSGLAPTAGYRYTRSAVRPTPRGNARAGELWFLNRNKNSITAFLASRNSVESGREWLFNHGSLC